MSEKTTDLNSQEYQQIITVPLGKTIAEVKQALGEPRKETPKDGYAILRYVSDTPSFATYFYFQNEQLVFKVIGAANSTRILDYYIQQYQNPEISVRKYSREFPDSLGVVVHVWSDKGLAVTTVGNDSQSFVQEIHQFAPISKEEYFASWGKEYAGHEEIALQSEFTTTASIAATPVGNEPSILLLKAELILGVFFGSMLCLGIFLAIRRRNKSRY